LLRPCGPTMVMRYSRIWSSERNGTRDALILVQHVAAPCSLPVVPATRVPRLDAGASPRPGGADAPPALLRHYTVAVVLCYRGSAICLPARTARARRGRALSGQFAGGALTNTLAVRDANLVASSEVVRTP